jgi:UDP-N-acetylglucosamine 3-dehydrogenase
MAGDRLRVGVVGVGSMGQNHVRVYREVAEVVGIADPDAAKGEELSRRFHVVRFDDHKALLGERPDAVSVATPTESHYAVARDFLEAGVHVLVEKPLCATPEEAEKLVGLAEKEGLVLAVGHIERHNPAVAYAKGALAEGRFGDLITISARRVSRFPDRVRDVGVILDLGIHEVDVQRHLVGSPVETVYAHAGRHRNERFEDYANILLRFENGVSGFAEVNWLTPMKVRKMTLTCERNFVELDYTNQSLLISSSTVIQYDPTNLYRLPLEYDVREVRLRRQEPLKRELTDFLEAVRTGGRPLVTGEDGLETLRILHAAMRSHREGNPVRVA